MRGSYLHHKEIRAAQGVKLAAQNLESAVAGAQLLVVRPDDDLEALKAEVMEDMQDIFASVDRSGKPCNFFSLGPGQQRGCLWRSISATCELSRDAHGAARRRRLRPGQHPRVAGGAAGISALASREDPCLWHQYWASAPPGRHARQRDAGEGAQEGMHMLLPLPHVVMSCWAEVMHLQT